MSNLPDRCLHATRDALANEIVQTTTIIPKGSYPGCS